MASLFARRRVNHTVAHSSTVQDWLDKYAERAAHVADAALASDSETHFRTGKSHIEWSVGSGRYGNVDREIALVDSNSGKEGAMSIEFGRNGARGRGTSRGIHALRKGIQGAGA